MIARLLFVAALPAVAFAQWKPLFNGKSLDGWAHEGNRMTFSATDGAIRCSGTGFFPNWLHTEREYENFRLRFEYKLEQWGEGAVILRSPRGGHPLKAGLSLYLANDYHQEIGSYATGGIPGVRPPMNPKKFGDNEWHAVEVAVDGDLFEASIDGVLKQKVDIAQEHGLRWKPKAGFIGFPDEGYRWTIRKVDIQELPSRTKIANLFDGTTLTGWTLRGDGSWSARDGSIVGENAHNGNLYAPGEFGDFEFSAMVRAPDHVNSGVFVRGFADEDKTRGQEIQIYHSPDEVHPTGSIYNIARSRIDYDLADHWFFIQVFVRGRTCTVLIDGDVAAETDRLPESVLAPGRIGLQIHTEDRSVWFRDLRVRPL